MARLDLAVGGWFAFANNFTTPDHNLHAIIISDQQAVVQGIPVLRAMFYSPNS